jgi:hypothetical protein
MNVWKAVKKEEEEEIDWFVEVTSLLSLQPRPILKAAGAEVATGVVSAKQITFSPTVRERQFARLQMGSCSVPQQGGFSLGLDWNVVRETEIVLEDCEKAVGEVALKRKHPCQKANFASELPRLTEKERRALLSPEECGGECGHADAAVVAGPVALDGGEGGDLDQLRASRGADFCNCGSLGLVCSENPNCFCSKNGIQCHVEGFGFCPCSRNCCGNPEGMYIFNFDAVRRARVAILGPKTVAKTPKKKVKKTRKVRAQPAAPRTPSRGHGGSTMQKVRVGAVAAEAGEALPGLLQMFLQESNADHEMAPGPEVEAVVDDDVRSLFNSNILDVTRSGQSRPGPEVAAVDNDMQALFNTNILGVTRGGPSPFMLQSTPVALSSGIFLQTPVSCFTTRSGETPDAPVPPPMASFSIL